MEAGVLLVSGLTAAAIVLVLAIRVRSVMRAEKGQGRGTAPGRGMSVIRSEYFSGGGGGGEARDYEVPRDPQRYARLFVPKDNGKAGKT